MARRGKRRRVAEGIYADRSGLSAIAIAGGDRQERRYPPGTDLDVIRGWRERTRATMRKRALRGRSGTLAGDGREYLRLVSHLASLKARRIEVAAWIAALGAETLRDTVTADDVRRVRVRWLNSGTSPKTINNRVQTLRHWFRTLDGKDVPTPCDAVSPLPVTKTPPVYITPELVQQVDAELQRREQAHELLDTKTRARFRVLATTGKRPSEIMRAEPDDVDLGRRVWIVRDGKGGYSPGLYLNDDMLAAWFFFVQANAWGPYNTNSFARTLRASGWPKGVKPYNLRHTTWITASERGADLADVQAGAGHKHIATTRKHYVPVLNSRMQRLSELIDGRFQWQTVPTAVPTGTLTTAHNPAPTRIGSTGSRVARTRQKPAISKEKR